MKTDTIKYQTIQSLKDYLKKTKYDYYTFHDFPFNMIGNYRYHLTYQGKIVLNYLFEQGFTTMRYSKYDDKTNKKINGNARIFINSTRS